jgi:hypothetical protein
MTKDAAGFDIKSNLRQVMADLKEFDPKLATGVRKALRNAGEPAITEMGNLLDEYRATSGERKSKGTRDEIKSGLKFRVTTGKTRSALRLNTTSGEIRKALNAKSWRHPVFGTGEWAEQQGTGYFSRGAMSQRGEVEDRIRAAIRVALEAVETRSTTTT